VTCTLLVSWKNEVEMFTVEDRIEDWENRTSWVANYSYNISHLTP